MSVTVMAGQRTTHNRARRRLSRAGLHIFLTVLAFIFAWPLLYALYMSLRPYGEIVANPNGPFSLPATLSLDNYFRSGTPEPSWAISGTRPSSPFPPCS